MGIFKAIKKPIRWTQDRAADAAVRTMHRVVEAAALNYQVVIRGPSGAPIQAIIREGGKIEFGVIVIDIERDDDGVQK